MKNIIHGYYQNYSHESFRKFMTDLEIYIDGFTSPTQIATEDTPEASNDAYINGLLLLFCKNLEMKITQLSVEEKQTLKEIFSRSKLAKEHRKLRRRNPKL